MSSENGKGALQTLFDSETKWTRRAFARDQDGNSVRATSDSACCWCLLGALFRLELDFSPIRHELDRRIEARWPNAGIVQANDVFVRNFDELCELIEGL